MKVVILVLLIAYLGVAEAQPARLRCDSSGLQELEVAASDNAIWVFTNCAVVDRVVVLRFPSGFFRALPAPHVDQTTGVVTPCDERFGPESVACLFRMVDARGHETVKLAPSDWIIVTQGDVTLQSECVMSVFNPAECILAKVSIRHGPAR